METVKKVMNSAEIAGYNEISEQSGLKSRDTTGSFLLLILKCPTVLGY